MSIAKRLIEEQIEQNAKEAEAEEASFERVEKFFNEQLNQPEREWVGLTDEEAWEMLEQMSLGASIEDVRFVEAKLKDKNVSHVGCFSYPNCDIDPNGCVVRNGDKAEQYGFKD